MARVIVVEDDPSEGKLVSTWLRHAGHEVRLATAVPAGIELVEAAPADAAVLDVRLGTEYGFDVAARCLEFNPRAAIVFVTGFSSDQLRGWALLAGASAWIEKPFSAAVLIETVDRVLCDRRSRGALAESGQKSAALFEGMIGESPAMREVFRRVAAIATLSARVLVTGESGTGKELVAQALHRLSGRPGPLHVLNCAAVPDSLIENELFGHERGAFTDAREAMPGLFERTHRGTLLLDEISELPLASQAKLLRVCETGRVTRLGAGADRTFDVRIVAATNRDLRQASRDGRFREDLYYRLSELSIALPPVRQRGSDVGLLVDCFFADARQAARRPALALTDEARASLLAYEWPGNVREIRHVLLQVAATVAGAEASVHDLPAEVIGPTMPDTQSLGPAVRTLAAEMTRHEQAVVRAALVRHGGNRTKTAAALGIDRSTLIRKLGGGEE